MRAGGPLRGEVQLPGDKSISHRALVLSSIASGPSRIRGLLRATDVEATANAVRALGARVEADGPDAWVITPPTKGLEEPDNVIDCGNSGTSMRLLAGLLAPQPFLTVLTGDDSLRRRPMDRVVEPLRRKGAHIDGRAAGTQAPLVIRGTELRAHDHDLEVASAQVKSALLLAGLRCGGAVREPRRSRDHTERMLMAMGVTLRRAPERWLLAMPHEGPLDPVDWNVPGDISSAAFLMGAAAINPGSEVQLRGVGMNPTRTGIIDVLEAMGADLQVVVDETLAERLGDVVIRASDLRGTNIDGDLALRTLDELPMVAVLAACAEGTTTIRDAGELRVKESDRIARTAEGLRRLGIMVVEHPDGMTIEGGRLVGPATVDASGDHRIAMAFSVAATVAEGAVTVQGAHEVATSFPGFFDVLDGLRS